ncbi:hypothetical protein ACN47E_007158 [Coniothyrium glycines]
MDPLSVTASIVGILAAAGKIAELLHGTISTAKDAPRVVISLACEVQEVRTALSSLQILLADLSSSQTHRAALIQIDQLIVTLTDSVLTFSELETAIAPYIALQGAKVPLRARLKWVRAEDSCLKIVDRLQRHKATICLMLNILQCASDADANRSQSSLELLVQKLLQDNSRLGKRLRNLEDAFDAMSVMTRDTDGHSIVSVADDATITSVRPSASQGISIVEAVKLRFAFDDDLQSSRAYRMVQHRDCGHSMLSSAMRTQTWSIFSGLSLADISVISVIALPLYPEDVDDHGAYYQFGQPKPEEITATWTHAQAIVDTSTEAGNVEDDLIDGESSSGASTPTGISNNQSLSIGETSVTSLGLGPPYAHDETLQRLESRADGYDSHFDNEPRDLAVPEDLTEALEEFDDELYPCKGCGQILEEGKAFELAGNRWHIDCFRCNTCATLLDSDANLLLHDDGSLMCNNCTYDCNACGNKITDLAILTGDQVFCGDCFKCRNCKRKIENLRYARTSQGIFCMSCHEALLARKRKKKRLEELPKADTDQPMPVLPAPVLPTTSGSILPPGFTTAPPLIPRSSKLLDLTMGSGAPGVSFMTEAEVLKLFSNAQSSPSDWDAFLASTED